MNPVSQNPFPKYNALPFPELFPLFFLSKGTTSASSKLSVPHQRLQIGKNLYQSCSNLLLCFPLHPWIDHIQPWGLNHPNVLQYFKHFLVPDTDMLQNRSPLLQPSHHFPCWILENYSFKTSLIYSGSMHRLTTWSLRGPFTSLTIFLLLIYFGKILQVSVLLVGPEDLKSVNRQLPGQHTN